MQVYGYPLSDADIRRAAFLLQEIERLEADDIERFSLDVAMKRLELRNIKTGTYGYVTGDGT